MKKNLTILLSIILIISCSKSNQKTTGSTTTPPATNTTVTTPANTVPAAVTALCCVWQLDSIRQFRVNVSGHPTSDTLLGAIQYFSVPTATLSFQSSVTSYTFGTEVISGYAYNGGSGGGSPSSYYTPGITSVWNILGDTLKLPTTNHPNACTQYWTVILENAHLLTITDRVWGKNCASGAQSPYYEWDYQTWYYHK